MISSSRRARLVLTSVFAFGFLLLFRSWITLPEYLKDIDYDVFSHITGSGGHHAVDEIYGLLHVVTTEGAVLNESQDWDLKSRNLDRYSMGRQVDWVVEKKRIDAHFPVIVFSKTYCPFSKKAKDIIGKYGLNPPMNVVEVDQRSDGDAIKVILTRLTGLGTVPNTLVYGKSLGDSGAIVTFHGRGELRDKLAGK